ncbi:LysM peptidoglycan-binding domain-containing protein [Paenibacillus zeisoli]|uniref:LysM peptidoglycan-binding domain-containing protein n=1 Tax=Paenibacillus zeisoli TaxID=2496267 RepID=A0A433XRD2_9BACL|nr:LysM peptidoglycan-binding domain-containing protein [Paenibacillus zeisoli]RUT36630.1 LysM peptidoglycan-binding domain-containing protein [Paenibacillus zeisoli]
MEFSLRDGNGENFVFPVNPEEVQITRERGYDTVSLLSLGDFDFPQGERVKEITFSSFFPKVYNESYCNYKPVPDPQKAMNKLTTFLHSKTPLRLIITGTQVNTLVIIASHNSTFRGGETGDVYFDLTMRTWRELKVGKLGGAVAGSGAKSSRPDLKKSPKIYIVKPGDSLSKIAKLQLGSSARWKEIYKLNKLLIGNDPNKIRVGQKLVMP